MVLGVPILKYIRAWAMLACLTRAANKVEFWDKSEIVFIIYKQKHMS